MNKYYTLIGIIVILTLLGFGLFQSYRSQSSKDIDLEDVYCEVNSDCISFAVDCGDCNPIPLNKSTLPKYEKARASYCASQKGPILMCDRLYKNAKCVNNTCRIE